MSKTTDAGAPLDLNAFAAIRFRLELAYRLCCGLAPKQAVGELLDTALKMPEWKSVHAALARRAASSPQSASVDAIGQDEGALNIFAEVARKVMRDYRMSNMICGEGDPCDAYPLVDLLSTEGETIATGQHEIDLIVESICEEARAALAHPSVSPAPVVAACSGCDPAEGFCRACRDAEQQARGAASQPAPAPVVVASDAARRLSERLKWMLDADQFRNVESMLSAIAAPVGVIPDVLYQSIKDMQDAAYTFGDNCQEAVRVALDGVLNAMREIDSEAAAHPDDAAVDRFAAAMKAKMAAARTKGRGGWDDKGKCPTVRLQSMLCDNIEKGDPVDVGNFAMMLWNRGEKVAAVSQAAPATCQPSGAIGQAPTAEPTMLWDADDPEDGTHGDSPMDFARNYIINSGFAGEIEVDVLCAYRGDKRTMRIVATDDQAVTWSWVATPAEPSRAAIDTKARDEK